MKDDTHQEARLVGFYALLQRLLNVNGPTYSVLCGAERQLYLQCRRAQLTASAISDPVMKFPQMRQ